MQVLLDENIIPVWQPLGKSTYRITNEISRRYGQKATHTGVLDPMAEGVVVVLLGDRRFDKQKMTATKKGYEFTVVFGISTDSYDGMGLVTATDFNVLPSKTATKQVLSGFSGKYEQQVPLYSARKVAGKKLFMYPKLGLELPNLPKKSGEIYDIQLLDYKENVKIPPLLTEITDKIHKIDIGEFRQQEIIDTWAVWIKKLKGKTSAKATFYAEISRGLYVRSLSQDICKKLGALGFVTGLIRTKNGDYTRENSYTLEDILS